MKKLNNKGLTLIELLVALAIVGLGIITMFSSVNSNLKVNTKNDKDIKSLQIAQSEIENLRSQIKSKSPDSFKINTYKEEQDKEEVEEISLKDLEKEDGISYFRIIDGKSNIYNINLKVTDDPENLYTIDIKVSSQNEDFSGKSTHIVTKVFGK